MQLVPLRRAAEEAGPDGAGEEEAHGGAERPRRRGLEERSGDGDAAAIRLEYQSGEPRPAPRLRRWALLLRG
jgi:hypothetical protein